MKNLFSLLLVGLLVIAGFAGTASAEDINVYGYYNSNNQWTLGSTDLPAVQTADYVKFYVEPTGYLHWADPPEAMTANTGLQQLLWSANTWGEDYQPRGTYDGIFWIVQYDVVTFFTEGKDISTLLTDCYDLAATDPTWSMGFTIVNAGY